MISVLLFSVICSFVFACRLDSSLHGVYKKQSFTLHNMVFDSALRDPVIYDELSITATSISEYGECYEQTGDAYIFGLKRMGRDVCFRCVTPIPRAPNVLQLAHQQEDVCYDSIREAKVTCFDSKMASISDGILVFKSENIEESSCGVDGRLSVGYELNGASLSCQMDDGSTADNCDGPALMQIKFRNCSFPDFDMSMRCIGAWQTPDSQHYIIVRNEENEEYRCGLLQKSMRDTFVYFSNDSSCAQLSTSSAFEKYTFREGPSTQTFSPCQFPDWLRGDYDSLTVTPDILQYNQKGAGSVPVTSHCVHIANDRILVYSETKCGEPLGYHCLWFNPRSNSLMEFKTTSAQETANHSLCGDESEFSSIAWTSAVIQNPSPAPCGILGRYRTPKDMRIQDCYNVSVDCTRTHSMQISAYNCQSGVVFDSRTYKCIASWRDDPYLFMYATRTSDTHSCFVTQYQGGRLFLASTGAHCTRSFNYTENADKTIVLEEDVACHSPQRPKMSRRPINSSKIGLPAKPRPPSPIEITNLATPPSTTIPPLSIAVAETTPEIQWIWEVNGAKTPSLLIFCMFILFVIT